MSDRVSWVPDFSEFRGYTWPRARLDLQAGVTVAVFAVPQAMAYAMLAGVAPVYGLYAAMVMSLVATLWGSSPYLNTGPTNSAALLTFGAVLPFLNVDGGQESQTFANGLVDDVINRLARVPGLSVSARGDSFTLEPNTASNVVRDRLRVAMYIEGSVEMAADSIRVIVQLIDSATGRHMQSRTFNQPRENYFEVRDAITDLTVSSLRVALPDDVQAKSQATAHVPEYDA